MKEPSAGLMVFLRPRWASVSVPDAPARDDIVLFAVLLVARPTTAPRHTPRCRQTSGRRRLRSRHCDGSAPTPGPEYLFATPCRIGHKSDNWAPVWPCGRVPRGVPGAVVGFVGSRQSPLVQLVVTHTEPEPLRSPPALPGFVTTMGSSDFCHGLPSADRCPVRSPVTDLPRCVVWRRYVLRPIPRRGCPCASVL
jgi:hypothetical protein